MIRDKAIARQVNELMLDYGAKLDASVMLVKTHCSPEELEEYRAVVGRIMGEMLDVMNPVYAEHPELKPKEFN